MAATMGASHYVKDGKLRYGYNYVAQDYFYIGSSDEVPEGYHFLSFEFTPTGKADLARNWNAGAAPRRRQGGRARRSASQLR